LLGFCWPRYNTRYPVHKEVGMLNPSLVQTGKHLICLTNARLGERTTYSITSMEQRSKEMGDAYAVY